MDASPFSEIIDCFVSRGEGLSFHLATAQLFFFPQMRSSEETDSVPERRFFQHQALIDRYNSTVSVIEFFRGVRGFFFRTSGYRRDF